jgi:hypothetical protein
MQTDMRMRADNWRYLRNFLLHVEDYVEDAYVNNNTTYIKIGKICIVDFVLNKESQVLIRNIYFEDTTYTNDDTHQPQKLNTSKTYKKLRISERQLPLIIRHMVTEAINTHYKEKFRL